MRVGIIQTYKPVFLSKRAEHIHSVSKPDCFEKSEFNFDDECKILYSKLEKSMGIVTPQDIIKQANRVSKKTGVPLDDVYDTMGLLSQYSSYKSLGVIEDELKKRDIKAINNLGLYYKENNCGTPLCLTNVLQYISLKNFGFKSDYNCKESDKKALFIDNNLIDIALGDDEFYSGRNNELFYIENFENGYNFLNQNMSFEDFTIDIIEKAKTLKSYTGKDFKYNVRYALNGRVMENIDAVSRGGHIHVIKQKNIATPEKIADNLNPIMPDYEVFKNTLDDISKKHLLSKTDGEKYVINSMNLMFDVVTPQQLSKDLQVMQEKIVKYLKDHHRDFDKVYYVVPNKNKSFALINYQYKQANNIDKMQNYILSRNSISPEGLDLKNMPDGSTLVILDDYLLSGQSMKREQFPYETMAVYDNSCEKKNINVIFAPLVSTKRGLFEFNEFINNSGRGGKDCIITAKVLPECNLDDSNMPFIHSSEFLTSSVMPYMGPDTNAEEFVPLYEKFLYSPYAQKETLSEFGFLPFG